MLLNKLVNEIFHGSLWDLDLTCFADYFGKRGKTERFHGNFQKYLLIQKRIDQKKTCQFF